VLAMKQTITNREAGFTLVELMMVIFVVGIMAGLVVMTVGGNTSRELKKDANRIQQLLVMAQDEATFSGSEIGFYIDDQKKAYGFLMFDDRKLTWEPMKKEAFTSRDIPEGTQLELSIDGDAVDLKKIYKDALGKTGALDNWLTSDGSNTLPGKDGSKNKMSPALIFFSDGHYTAFRLKVTHQKTQNTAYFVDGDGLGSIRISDTSGNKKNNKKRKVASG
jgi:type II secretion system protein H